LDALFKADKPSHAFTNPVSHGGHNILYGSFDRLESKIFKYQRICLTIDSIGKCTKFNGVPATSKNMIFIFEN